MALAVDFARYRWYFATRDTVTDCVPARGALWAILVRVALARVPTMMLCEA